MEVREKIRIFRENAGLTQQTLAEKTGLSRNAIGNYETGKRSPKWEDMEKIASALGQQMDAFTNPLPSPSPEGGKKEKPKSIMKDRHKRKVPV